MAQLPSDGSALAERVRLVVRTRPGLALVLVLSAGALLGALVFGVASGMSDGGILLETLGEETSTARDTGTPGGDGTGSGSASSDDDEGDASSSDGGAVGEGTSEDAAARDDASEKIVVDISGAVAEPKVLELSCGSRIQDAIEAAGGLSDDADISGVNRAQVLSDGAKIVIPRIGEIPSAASSSSASGQSGPSSASSAADSSSVEGTALININTADASALDTLPGVGPSTARAILEDRERNGTFSSPEDLMRVSGIGEKKFEKLRSLICV